MPVTVTSFLGPNIANAAKPTDGVNKYYVIKNKIDFKLRPSIATDIIQALWIPANTLVYNVAVKVLTAQGATCTVTVGDGNGANSWDGSSDLNAAANTITCGAIGTDAYCTAALGPGKPYMAADTIDLVLGHTTDIAVIEVFAFCIDLSG